MGGNTRGRVYREPYADDHGSDFPGSHIAPIAPGGPHERRQRFWERRQVYVYFPGSVTVGNAAAAILDTAGASADRFLHHSRFAWLD